MSIFTIVFAFLAFSGIIIAMQAVTAKPRQDLIAERLSHYGVDACLLELEVTEQTIMADPKRVTSVLAELKEIGVTIALDDFGTGYSSLLYLMRLPVNEIKIDRSFVSALATDPDSGAIVRSWRSGNTGRLTSCCVRRRR